MTVCSFEPLNMRLNLFYFCSDTILEIFLLLLLTLLLP